LRAGIAHRLAGVAEATYRWQNGDPVARQWPSLLKRLQLRLQLEGEIERQQIHPVAFDRAPLVRGERREVVADRNDRHGLGQTVDRRHVGELRPLAGAPHVTDHRGELSLQEAVGIGQRQQQHLQIEAFRSYVRLAAGDRMRVEIALARERMDRVRVEPGLRRNRRVRQVAVHEHARRGLQAAHQQRDQPTGAAKEQPHLGLARAGAGDCGSYERRRFRFSSARPVSSEARVIRSSCGQRPGRGPELLGNPASPRDVTERRRARRPPAASILSSLEPPRNRAGAFRRIGRFASSGGRLSVRALDSGGDCATRRLAGRARPRANGRAGGNIAGIMPRESRRQDRSGPV
jgi:hypothetical protein